MSGIATAIIASAVLTTGYAAYSGQQQKKEIKKAQASAEEANRKQLEEAALAQSTAESQAKAQIKEKRRRMASSDTIFTSPMGIASKADTARKTILGA